MKLKSHHILPTAIAGFFAAAAPASAAIIAASGWNADVVWGDGETYASHGSPIANNFVWFTTDITTDFSLTGGGGLDPTGAVTVGGIDFQFQPFTGNTNNALVGNGTITLDTPRQFTEISFLASRTGNGAAGNLILNFAGGTTATVVIGNNDFPNWATGTSQISPDPRLTNNGTSSSFNGAIGALTLDLTNLNSTDYSGLTLNSVERTGVGGTSHTLFALSGIPEPSTALLAFVGLSGLMVRRRR